MYRAIISSNPVQTFESDSLFSVVDSVTNTALKGELVSVYYVIDGLCGPEVQDPIMEYIEDGWKSP
jgi:hypothetical protein